MQQFVSFPLHKASCSWRDSLLVDSFFLRSVPLYSSCLCCALSVTLSFIFSVSCFLPCPRRTYVSSNSFRQHVISSLKDSASSSLSSQAFLRDVFCISSLTSQSVVWFSDITQSQSFFLANHSFPSLVSSAFIKLVCSLDALDSRV